MEYAMMRTASGIPYRLYPDGLVTVEARRLARLLPQLSFAHPGGGHCDPFSRENDAAIERMRSAASKVLEEIKNEIGATNG